LTDVRYDYSAEIGDEVKMKLVQELGRKLKGKAGRC